MYIKRNLEDKILKFLDDPEILAIVGPRQAGKTTLMHKIFTNLEKAKFVSFEDRDVLSMFDNNVNDFIKIYVKNTRFLFIDEFQYSKHDGGQRLKYIYDNFKDKVKIVISGSSAIDLTVKAMRYLVGRIIVFELFPLDFYEYLWYQNQNYLALYKELKQEFYEKGISPYTQIGEEVHHKFLEYYYDYVIYGGYPRVVVESDEEKKKVLLKNIYNTYFLREVRDILGLIDDYKLENLLKGLALQIGSMVEYSELSNLSGYSYHYVKKYLNFLDKTYITFLLSPFFSNKRVEVVKNPKVYFFDTGLRNIVVNDFRSINFRTDKGFLLENALASQLVKSSDKEIKYWRDKKKNEIDFIVQLSDNRYIAYEVKTKMKTEYLRSVKAFKERYPEIDVYIACIDKSELVDYTKAVPLYII